MRHFPNNQKAAIIGLILLMAVSWAASRGSLAARTSLLGSSQEQLEEPFVVRIYYDEIADLVTLQSYDVWEYNNLGERYVLAAVDRTGYERLIDQGWKTEIDPIQQLAMASVASDWEKSYDSYRTVDELYDDLQAINSNAPSLTEIVEFGQSHCQAIGGCQTPGGDILAGFPLLALRITNEEVPGSSVISDNSITRGTKPVFFLMANIHAREITTPELAMRFIDYLIDGYDSDADATWLVDHREIWIVPTTNPDGLRLVELGLKGKYGGNPFYQRKNANNDADQDGEADCPVWPPSSYDQYGVDLNRNHSWGWGPPASSNQPCDLTYRGPSEASEVETRALETLVRALVPDQRAADLNAAAPRETTGLLITLHSFSNLVLWPWGNSEMLAPNRDDLKAIGDKLATYNNYTSCQPALCLYLTNGSTDDWAYGELGIPAFTFEIGNQFMPPYAEIDAIQWPENRPAFVHAAKIAQQPYLTVHGPDSVNVATAVTSSQIAVTATIDDRLNGGEPIAAAVYSIDTPPENEHAVVYPLAAADGMFDSKLEDISGIVNLSGLNPGRHILFVRGQDSNQNWGAISAVFFDVATTWLFEKDSLLGYALPGDAIPYRINLEIGHGSGEHTYELAIVDQLPGDLSLLVDTVTVNGVARPDIYDDNTRTLRYEAAGSFEQQLIVTIAFSAKVSEDVPVGWQITNTATVEAIINSETLTIPPAVDTVFVLSSTGISFVPVVVNPQTLRGD